LSRVSLASTGFFLPMRNLVFILFLFTSTLLFSQTYRVAYVQHNLSQPGITIAKPITWTSKIKDKKKKKGLKQIGKTNLILPQFTYYNHIRKENNFSFGAELVRQRHRIKPANWKCETAFGLHYVRSFNAGKTFELRDGEFKRIRFAGQNYLAPSLSYSLSRGFLKKRSTPIHAFLKPQVLFLMPYNSSVIPSVNIQFGVNVRLNSQVNE
jgi:hypothetical protein